MKLADIDNIWSADLSLLSNADRGRVYYERAKQVVQSALSDSKERRIAIESNRFRRDYLAQKIGCSSSATTQNPRIRSLLIDTDVALVEEHEKSNAFAKAKSIDEIKDFNELRDLAFELQRKTMKQAELIALLRKRHIR
jgi:hypothetical protein